MGDDDRILDRKPVFRHEGAAAPAEVSHEGIAEIVHSSPRDQGAGDVRPPHRAAVRLNKYFVQSDRDAEYVEPVDDFFRPSVAEGAQLEQSPLQGFRL